MIFHLTCEQAKILEVAKLGHNIFFTGEAGTGKSYLIGAIVDWLRKSNKTFTVMCSSGIACTVHKAHDIKAVTVHSHYALDTADLPWRALIQRSISQPHQRQRILNSNTIIWDEASMSSGRVFEITNAIHHNLLDRTHSDKRKPFGGKQVIITGEFLQLRPVPSFFDSGRFIFETMLFDEAITHRFELTQIMRQDATECELRAALKDLRLGKCSESTIQFLRGLDRPLSQELYDKAVHIYFRNIPTQLHNLQYLYSMPGELQIYDCEESGNISGISSPAMKRLILKPHCKVMLVWNLNDDLKNGSCGIFEAEVDGKLRVHFPGFGKIMIKREVWTTFNRSGKVVGQMTQYPLILSHAITCHKSQGLTLDSVVVHFSSEFVSGLTYVAVSRVQYASNLQLLNFNPTKLVPPSEEVLRVCVKTKEIDLLCDQGTLACCRDKSLSDDIFNLTDEHILKEPEDEDFFSDDTVDENGEPRLVCSFFERPDDNIHMDENADSDTMQDNQALPPNTPSIPVKSLESIYISLLMDDNQELSSLPDNLDVNKYLKEEKTLNPQTVFAKEKVRVIDHLLQDTDRLNKFAHICWLRVFVLFRDFMIENLDELLIIRKEFTNTTQMFYLMTGKREIIDDMAALFLSDDISSAQRSVCCAILKGIYQDFIHFLCDRLSKQHETEPLLDVTVDDMTPEGQAKLRYVAGWAVRRCLENGRRYIRSNITSANESTYNKVKRVHSKVELIEENLTIPFDKLRDETSFPETLEITEFRQHRCRGLIHVPDCVFMFIKELEDLRIRKLNESRMNAMTDKSAIIDHVLNEMLKSDILTQKWMQCFDESNLKNEMKVRYLRYVH